MGGTASDLYHMPALLSLAVVVLILAVSLSVSFVRPSEKHSIESDETTDGEDPLRDTTEKGKSRNR